MYLDYSIDTVEGRKAAVEQLLKEYPTNSTYQLEQYANYLIFCNDKQERKAKQIITSNRAKTIYGREKSYEAMLDSTTTGEDLLDRTVVKYDDKTTIFKPRDVITAAHMREIPFLAQLRESIQFWEQKTKESSGRAAYIAKSTAIEQRKDQYIIRNAYLKPLKAYQQFFSKPLIHFDSTFDADFRAGTYSYSGISLCNPTIVSLVLSNYSKLKQDSEGDFLSDVFYFMLDFDNIADAALADQKFLERLVILKIDKRTNAEIVDIMEEEFGETHTEEYYSTLFCKKIPKLIANKAVELNLIAECDAQLAPKKRCSKCKQLKPAHPFFFSRNRGDYYTVCKECRRKVKK